MAREKGIRISPKHGLNPCIPICVFCGKERNEIACLGKLKNDAKAPMHAVIDYVPCDECQNNWKQGVPLIKVVTKPLSEGMPPLTTNEGQNLYPAGEYIVVTKEAVQHIFGVEGEIGSPILVEDAAFDDLVESAKESGAIKENGDAPGVSQVSP